jgi:streptomycin 3"-adenylyltransferase
VFRSPPREALLQLLRDSIRWQEGQVDHSADAILNACRAVRFARTGQWTSKTAAGEWALEGLGGIEVVKAALAARRDRGRPTSP